MKEARDIRSILEEAQALHQQGQTARAVEQFEIALKLDPTDDIARKALAQVTHRQGMKAMSELKLEEAKKAYRRALELEPDNAATLNNLAMIFQHEGHHAEARKLYDHALRMTPDNLPVRYNRSICSLTEERFEEGWADFGASEPHWRNMQDGRQNLPWMKLPLWDGGDVHGRKILIWGDQGIGDEIAYISMLPDLIERGAKVTIECADRLVPIIARSFPEITVLPRQKIPLPGTDFYCHAPGMWLARCVRPAKDSFPSRHSFLKADPAKTAQLRKRYEAFGKKRIVGLSWFTGSIPWSLKRSVPLPDMLKPLKLDDMLIVDLQYGNATDAWKQAQKVFPRLTSFRDPEVDQLKDMDAFAAQVAACDFVLTISNTVSHVAGALGVPAAILMPDVALAWYWFAMGEKCPWYPSLTLLRPDAPDRMKRAAAMAEGKTA